MKKYKSVAYLLLLLFFPLVISSCSDPDEIPVRTGNVIESISVRPDAGNSNDVYDGVFSEETEYIYFNIPKGAQDKIDITYLTVTAHIPIDANISPSLRGKKDLSEPFKITVTAGDGSKKIYYLLARYV